MRVTQAKLPKENGLTEIDLSKSKGMLTPDAINAVNDATNIVDLIGESIELKRAGKEFTACCPFHREKTPSFTVNEDKQFYHCFGCGAHGNAINFTMDYLHYEFIETVEYLAERESIELSFQKGVQRNHVKAKSFAIKNNQPEEIDNQKSFFALLNRLNISKEAAEKRLISIILDNKGITDLIPNVGSPSLLFPVMDRRERVIGFALEDIKTSVPCIYPEDAIFGVMELKRREQLFIVESPSQAVRILESNNVDCVSYSSVLPTQEQLSKLFRLNSDCVFCFHIGLEGYRSAWTTLKMMLPILTSKNHIRILFFNHDLDEAIRSFSTDHDFAVNCSDFLLDKISEIIKREVDANTSVIPRPDYLANRSRVFTSLMPDGVYKDMFVEHLETSLIDQFIAPQSQIQELI